MSRHAPWQLDGSHAKLASGLLAARLDLADPASGLTHLTWEDIPLPPQANVLGVATAPFKTAPFKTAPCDRTATQPPIDAYLRGSDLIATYGPTASFPFRFQVYWRAQAGRYSDQAIAIELVVSIQTDLLDSRPRLQVTGLIPAASGSHWRSAEPDGDDREDFCFPLPAPREFEPADGIGCFRFKGAGSRVDYCELVHPSDFRCSSLAAENDFQPRFFDPADPPAFCRSLGKGSHFALSRAGIVLAERRSQRDDCRVLRSVRGRAASTNNLTACRDRNVPCPNLLRCDCSTSWTGSC